MLGTLNASPRAGSFFAAPAVRAGQLASYRRLAARLALAAGSDFPRSLLVVGADGGHGSGKVAVDLGLSLALDGHRVAVADFEGDGITRYLQMDGRERGASLVSRSGPVASAGITFDRFRLRAGPALLLAVPRFPPRGLSLGDAETVVSDLSADADVVIVHGPQPTRSRGALTWAPAAVGTLLVVGAGQTKRTDLEDAVETLEPIGRKLLGAVLQTGATDAAGPSTSTGDGTDSGRAAARPHAAGRSSSAPGGEVEACERREPFVEGLEVPSSSSSALNSSLVRRLPPASRSTFSRGYAGAINAFRRFLQVSARDTASPQRV